MMVVGKEKKKIEDFALSFVNDYEVKRIFTQELEDFDSLEKILSGVLSFGQGLLIVFFLLWKAYNHESISYFKDNKKRF